MKGISPIIAVVILIGFTLTIGVLVSSWITQLSTQQTTESETTLSECKGLMYSFSKLDVTYTTSDHILTIKVTNIGTKDIYGFSVEVANSTYIAGDVPIVQNVLETDPLRPQGSAYIKADLTNYLEMGKLEYVKVLNSVCPTYSFKVEKEIQL